MKIPFGLFYYSTLFCWHVYNNTKLFPIFIYDNFSNKFALLLYHFTFNILYLSLIIIHNFFCRNKNVLKRHFINITKVFVVILGK